MQANGPTNGLPTVVILCADRQLREVITYWFRSLSIPAFNTVDGYEANVVLKAMDSGLLIIDRALPPWPGLDTFKQLTAANPRLRIAFVDDGSRDGATLARLTGAHVILTQPLDAREVLAAMGRPELVP